MQSSYPFGKISIRILDRLTRIKPGSVKSPIGYKAMPVSCIAYSFTVRVIGGTLNIALMCIAGLHTHFDQYVRSMLNVPPFR